MVNNRDKNRNKETRSYERYPKDMKAFKVTDVTGKKEFIKNKLDVQVGFKNQHVIAGRSCDIQVSNKTLKPMAEKKPSCARSMTEESRKRWVRPNSRTLNKGHKVMSEKKSSNRELGEHINKNPVRRDKNPFKKEKEEKGK